MSEYSDFNYNRIKNDYKEEKEKNFKKYSSNRLYGASKKKIQTTMIGALVTFEKYFGDLLSDEELKDAFENARSEILDRGNSQIRNLEIDFSEYDITWKKNHIVLPFLEK